MLIKLPSKYLFLPKLSAPVGSAQRSFFVVGYYSETHQLPLCLEMTVECTALHRTHKIGMKGEEETIWGKA